MTIANDSLFTMISQCNIAIHKERKTPMMCQLESEKNARNWYRDLASQETSDKKKWRLLSFFFCWERERKRMLIFFLLEKHTQASVNFIATQTWKMLKLLCAVTIYAVVLFRFFLLHVFLRHFGFFFAVNSQRCSEMPTTKLDVWWNSLFSRYSAIK